MDTLYFIYMATIICLALYALWLLVLHAPWRTRTKQDEVFDAESHQVAGVPYGKGGPVPRMEKHAAMLEEGDYVYADHLGRVGLRPTGDPVVGRVISVPDDFARPMEIKLLPDRENPAYETMYVSDGPDGITIERWCDKEPVKVSAWRCGTYTTLFVGGNEVAFTLNEDNRLVLHNVRSVMDEKFRAEHPRMNKKLGLTETADLYRRYIIRLEEKKNAG